MEFTVEFYETNDDVVPSAIFSMNSKLPIRMISPRSWLAWPSCAIANTHREPLSKALGHSLFELRHVGKLNTRVLWFFMKGRRIVAVRGIRNMRAGYSGARSGHCPGEGCATWHKRA